MQTKIAARRNAKPTRLQSQRVGGVVGGSSEGGTVQVRAFKANLVGGFN